MNILLLGSGGREHAIAWKMAQSPLCEKLFIAPGNPGTSKCGENVPLNISDFDSIGKFCVEKNIHLLIPGPEAPLVAGITDYFNTRKELQNTRVCGPSKIGAQLEGSKDFAKQFLLRHNIPTAAYKTFSAAELNEGIDYLEKQSLPVVLKADGLAAGKGVVIAETLGLAKETLSEMLSGAAFGEAGSRVVVEEFMSGIELSVFILTDGRNYKIIPTAKDYKRVGEGDGGLNTGGMGAISPVPFADASLMRKIKEQIIEPTMEGLLLEKISYCGFLYFGLMNCGGNPKVVEYNCRMGDPETEAVIPLIESDLVELLYAASTGMLEIPSLKISNQHAATVVLASGGYPGEFEKGKTISGIVEAEKSALVFQAGTTLENSMLKTSGGRVIAVTGIGKNSHEALANANAAAEKIQFEKKYFRRDIGFEFR